jgi:aspartyl/glutamyl-tRNA(Asn/Gln) amidotransferase C subunit
MTDQINQETFEHLVDLAALNLNAEESEYLRQELNNQLRVINELAAIPLEEDVKITSHGVPYPPEARPALRDDEWRPHENPQKLIDESPKTEHGYIVVPDIPLKDLD